MREKGGARGQPQPPPPHDMTWPTPYTLWCSGATGKYGLNPAAAMCVHSCGDTPGEPVWNDACPLDAESGVMISLSDGGPLS